ncbi:MAG TPA: O-acetylhomoserine aminocarboxypropyltransferase/cysteine synthase family protein [Candidatus Dormibacteraeota bacterium]|nr:O-acetylhomoserine aminocarboxypropyltransferase/cysteine synthase family protein [Candidatus Dormibacteraeota bacterium]
MRDETIAIHGGYVADRTRAVAVPIYQTVAHDFADAEQAGAIFDLEMPGFHYNRLNNPTNDVLERRLSALEGGTGALTLSSGSAAVVQSVLNVASQGCNVVSAPQLYGATYTLFAHVLPTHGIEVRFAADDRAESIAPLIDQNTRAVFCESIGNPAGNVVDIEAVAAVAHAGGVPLIVDNTIATPLRLKPIEFGADVVVHSLTKFVGGHGTTLGGAIIDGGRFPWQEQPERFAIFNRPEPAFHGVVYAEQFPETAYIVRCRTIGMRNFGATLAPFNAFLLLQGLESLAVRLQRHEENARLVADYLAADPRVEWVSFSGFPEHPYFELSRRYLGGHAISVLTFGAVGGYRAALEFFDSVKLLKRLVNLGDVKSLVSHPASTTHRQLSKAEQLQVGVRPEAVRLSIGLEHIDDILEDVDQALAAAYATSKSPVGAGSHSA